MNQWDEAAYIKVPNGFSNAGRLIGIVRQDKPANSGGYARVYCDGDPTVVPNWSTPSLVISNGSADATDGRPSLLALQQNGSLGLVLLRAFYDKVDHIQRW
jgi:hypothetical protein